MKLKTRSREKREEDQAPDEVADDRARTTEAAASRSAETMNGTGGSLWASRAATGALWAAVVAGPLALAGVVVFAAAPQTVAPAAVEQVDVREATTAGETARDLVDAWLTATRENAGALQRQYPAEVASLPDEALPVRSVAVASVTDTGEGTWSVVVGADVNEPAPADSEADDEAEATTTWVRRYFQVPVLVAATQAGLGARADALPTPVAGPPLLADAPNDFTSDVAADTELHESVAGFLTAQLTGEGDIERYVSPGAVIAPIDPAPYSGVEIDGIKTSGTHENGSTPADGDQLDVLVDVALVRPDGEKTSAQYVLDLEARAGRWEVADISTANTTRPDWTPTSEGDPS